MPYSLFACRIRLTSVIVFLLLTAITPTFADDRSGTIDGLKTLDDHFPFHVPETVDGWHERAAQLRTRVQVATGLHPMPSRPPVEATIHSLVKKDGFTIEKVFFESMPGHYVTGLLFRPADSNGSPTASKRPGVLCPHGHGGRMMRHDTKTINALIASGDELYVASGSTAKLARCAQLARMGCVAFIFDMVGYADSVQLSYEFAHRRHTPRACEIVPGKNAPWHFFSTPADARLQSLMGLQTFNAVRSLDFLETLPDVDANRLAVTGGSGGGTQTILLGALDSRVRVSFPNGMVSTSMQGGCACENCCLLRIGTGNVELAALMAPRPMAMTAADDWTQDMMTDGYPELKRIYGMLGVPGNVFCEPLLQFKHNYNYVTRRVMYGWMNRHLGLGLDEPIVETDFESITDDEGAVWNDRYPAPSVRDEQHEREVLTWWDEQNRELLENALGSKATSTEFNRLVRPALEVLFDVEMPASDQVRIELDKSQRIGRDHSMQSGVVVDRTTGRSIPVQTISSAGADSTKQRRADRPDVVWINTHHDESVSTYDKLPNDIRDHVESGHRVWIVGTPEKNDPSVDATIASKQPMNPQPRRASAAFTFGYNRPLAVRRCGDILAVIAVAVESSGSQVNLISTSGAAAFALPAAAIAGSTVADANIAVDRFRFGDLRHQDDAEFVPGIVKYGDVDALAAWRAPHRLKVTGDREGQYPTARQIYSELGSENQLRIE
ncbi:alpha/beta hydrolase family protein [Neorhodopirellula pilleata]|uniref:Acetyl xylan esterase (AXE1) n=1 Tax=Neorhodopirellula pilleata TaxID=2714738 RepID=A0A5C6ADF5_9BACT|nr:acetylxylan esterase [Neorhodopirellula pilleata]TWT97470.1 hypothetical protein Pla100_26240 [Neorhodopirellula pilleata]